MTDFPEFVDETNTINAGAVLEKVLTAPQRAFAFIVTYQYQRHLHVLLVLAGMTRSFDRAVRNNMGDTMSLWGIIGFSIVVGGLFGWLSYYLYAFFMSWTGKWLNGTAPTAALLRVLAYSTIPTVLGLLVLFAQIAVYGKTIFMEEGIILEEGTLQPFVFYGLVALEIGLSLWSVVLLVIGIAEVQRFSVGKAVLNVLLPFVLLIGFIVLITVPFMLFE